MAKHPLIFGRLRSRQGGVPDNTTFTVAQIVMSPKILAVAAFFYIVLTIFRICLVSMIRINRVTFCDFAFHWRAMELLHTTRILLHMKDMR